MPVDFSAIDEVWLSLQEARKYLQQTHKANEYGAQHCYGCYVLWLVERGCDRYLRRAGIDVEVS